MKKYIFPLLLAAFALHGGEVKFSRQAVPRVNSIKIDDVTLSIDKDSRQWLIRAQKGTETRLVPVTPGGTDYVFLPGTILAVKNWNVARSNESWSIMQETIGDFEIQKLSPGELSKGGKFTVTGDKELTLSNGHMTLKCLPSFNGLVFSMRDNASKRELFNAPAVSGSLTLKTFHGTGFIELIDTFGKTPEAAFNYEFKNGTLTLKTTAQSVKNTLWQREMTMGKDAFKVSFRTSALPANEACRTALTIKHRPEFALPKGGIAAVNLMMIQADGLLKPMSAQESSAYETDKQSYCFADVNVGLLAGVHYENAGQLYVWCDKSYLAAEAFGKKTPVTEKPYMTANYFLVHGMSSADFISGNGVMKLSQTVLSGIAGNGMKLTVTYGCAVKLNSPAMNLAISGKAAKVIPLKGVAAGYSDTAELTLPVKALAAGEYTLSLNLTDSGKSIVSGKIPLRLLSQNDLQQYQQLLKDVDSRISAVRRSFKSGNRREKMRPFKALALMRKNIEDALKAGDFKALELLKKKYSVMP